jgi:hypothetical protein
MRNLLLAIASLGFMAGTAYASECCKEGAECCKQHKECCKHEKHEPKPKGEHAH